MRKMRSWFQKRAYPNKVLDEELVKLRFSSNQGKTCSKKDKGLSFPVTYHPMLQTLNDIIIIIKKTNWLYPADNEVKNLFPPGPIVSFRGAWKLSSYLVRAKVYPLKRRVGSCSCGKKRCQVCLNVTEMDSFINTSTSKAYKINHRFNCGEKCFVYLLTFRVCLKQYVVQRWMSSEIGETTIDPS